MNTSVLSRVTDHVPRRCPHSTCMSSRILGKSYIHSSDICKVCTCSGHARNRGGRPSCQVTSSTVVIGVFRRFRSPIQGRQGRAVSLASIANSEFHHNCTPQRENLMPGNRKFRKFPPSYKPRESSTRCPCPACSTSSPTARPRFRAPGSFKTSEYNRPGAVEQPCKKMTGKLWASEPGDECLALT